MNNIIQIAFVLLACVVVALFLLFLSFLKLWVRAQTSGVPIHIFNIIGMKLRGNPAQLLIDAYVLLSKEGVAVSLDETEYLFMRNRNRIRLPEELVRLVKEQKK